MEENKLSVTPADRERTIVRTSVTGIIVNVALSAAKAAVGFISGSIAVVLDAVNNLTDALSSVITIIGAKLAGRRPDKKHPLGHGRIEYVSSMIISALVLYAGVTSLIESIKKIITPAEADYSPVSLAIIAAAVIAKLLLGTYVKKQGKRVNSGALTASGSDALFDAILSASVLVSAIVFLTTGLSLEAYVGVIISLFIIRSGIEMLRESIDEILGRRMDPEITSRIREAVESDPSVMGAYDLILNSYGPERVIGSVHVEVPDTMTAEEIDAMERRIAGRVYEEHGVLLTGIGIYSVGTGEGVSAMRAEATRIIMKHEGVLQIHGFRVDEAEKRMNVDVILDYDMKHRDEVFGDICRELDEAFPEYKVSPIMDIDI
ncbi:MAG: cation transporter [Clostridia bacterium]|nr:cation transporter [Clostridia bacterium]